MIEDLASAADVEEQLLALYGDALTTRPPALLHVTSAWRHGQDLVTLRINQHTPPSPVDFFVLNLCRARADAILTTGEILRREPEMHHGLQGPKEVPRALSEWRRERLGKTSRPVSMVLTSGRDLDLEHPLFTHAEHAVIYTSPAGAERVAAARERGIEVVADAEPSPRGALQLLQERYRAATVSLEAGPSTARHFYAAPVLVDELLLSVYEAPELDPRARGPRFIPFPALERAAVERGKPFRMEEKSGPWAFYRFRGFKTAPPAG